MLVHLQNQPLQDAGLALCCAVPWHTHEGTSTLSCTPGAGTAQPLQPTVPCRCAALALDTEEFSRKQSLFEFSQAEVMPSSWAGALSVKTQCPLVLTWHVGSCLPKTFRGRGAGGGLLSFMRVPNWRRVLSAGTLNFLLRNSSVLWKT